MATTDGRKAAPLHAELINLGGGVSVDLGRTAVQVSSPGPNHVVNWLAMAPHSRQEANRMSIALKKASRRLQAIGETLPEETGGSS